MKENVRAFILLLGDIAALIGALLLGSTVNHAFDSTAPSFLVLFQSYLPLFLIWLIIFYVCELYNVLDLSRVMLILKRLGAATILMLVSGVGYFYIFTNISPKSDLIVIAICTLVVMFGWRFLVARIFGNYFKSGVLILGSHPLAVELAEKFNNNPHFGFSPIAVAATPNEAEVILATESGINLIITAEQSIAIDERLLSYLRRGYKLLDLGEAYETYLARIPVTFVDATWIVHKLQLKAVVVEKVIEELISKLVALIVLVVFSPIMLGIIIAIKLEDRGPLFIRQTRVGKLGKIFKLYKFRSMIVLGADGQAETGKAVWASEKDDPRITRVGRITRKLHIDEIPQMFNILCGDLTLVGPRPERPEFVEQLEQQIPHYTLRHIVKPGFTGWAQIKFRYARTVMDSQEKFEYDLFYIKNKNIFLDLGIIMKTVQIIVTH